MSWFARFLAALLAWVVAAPALAQVEGSRLNRYAEEQDAGAAFAMWAECAAELDPGLTKRLLATVPTTAAEAKVWEKWDGWNDRCMDSSKLQLDNKRLLFSGESARGELARTLVRGQLKQGRQPVAGAATAWLEDGLKALPAGAKFDRAILVGHQFAACLADEHWTEVRAFVSAQPDSPAEKAALAALSPKYGACMVAGAKLKLNRPLLRLLIGEAAYHALTYAPAGTGQPKAAAR